MKQSEIKHISEYNAAALKGDKVLRFTHYLVESERVLSKCTTSPDDYNHVVQVTECVFAAWNFDSEKHDPFLFFGEWVEVRS